MYFSYIQYTTITMLVAVVVRWIILNMLPLLKVNYLFKTYFNFPSFISSKKVALAFHCMPMGRRDPSTAHALSAKYVSDMFLVTAPPIAQLDRKGCEDHFHY